MMRLVSSVGLVFLLAIGGGAASVHVALDRLAGFDGLSVGSWVAFPNRGTPGADPYSKARFSRNAELPLGKAEGLAFTAAADSAGEPLRRACSYRIEGKVPAARFWTLYASDAAARPLPAQKLRWPGLHSMQVLRRADNSFEIVASPAPHPGNWLSTGGDGTMNLVLTLYDAPALGNPDAAEVELPLIYRTGCE
jgi:hypothetical protein